MAGYLIFTYGLFTLNSLSSLSKKKKGKVQEIRAYLNGNKKDGSLVGGIIDRRKKVPNQLASGKIEKLLDKYSFSR